MRGDQVMYTAHTFLCSQREAIMRGCLMLGMFQQRLKSLLSTLRLVGAEQPKPPGELGVQTAAEEQKKNEQG